MRRRRDGGQPVPDGQHLWFDGEVLAQQPMFVARSGFVVCFRCESGGAVQFDKWTFVEARSQSDKVWQRAKLLWNEARILAKKTELDSTIRELNQAYAGSLRRQAIELSQAADRVMECAAVAERTASQEPTR